MLTPTVLPGSRAQPPGRRVQRRARRRRQGGTGASPATPSTGATAFAPGLGATAPLAVAAERIPTPRGGSGHDRVGGREPARPAPIVQTITRIVGVIPTAVWIALGALLALAAALAVGGRLLALRARRLERQRGELLADVGLLQTTLLPAPPARRGAALTSTVAYRPADGPAAGGDFYDVFTLPDGSLATIVGDVSGHGRQALPHTALVRYTLRAYLEAGLSPREALRIAGAVLERQLDGALATALIASYRPRERTFVYAAAGHPPPIVLGTRTRLAAVAACSAPPIGAGMATGTRQSVISLPGPARVCLHTDGVTDARVGAELYGAERLAGTLERLGPDATAQELLERVSAQTDAHPDDMAACLLSLRGGSGEPATLVQELELAGESARERAERFLLACGMGLAQAARVAGEAGSEAEQAGSVLLEVRLAGHDTPSAVLRRDDGPDVHASDNRLLATVGAAS